MSDSNILPLKNLLAVTVVAPFGVLVAAVLSMIPPALPLAVAVTVISYLCVHAFMHHKYIAPLFAKIIYLAIQVCFETGIQNTVIALSIITITYAGNANLSSDEIFSAQLIPILWGYVSIL